MPLADRFSVEVDRVVHETIDGETIIIQLETGAYYSLVGPGAEIWSMLATGSSTDEVVAALQLRFQGTRRSSPKLPLSSFTSCDGRHCWRTTPRRPGRDYDDGRRNRRFRWSSRALRLADPPEVHRYAVLLDA